MKPRKGKEKEKRRYRYLLQNSIQILLPFAIAAGKPVSNPRSLGLDKTLVGRLRIKLSIPVTLSSVQATNRHLPVNTHLPNLPHFHTLSPFKLFSSENPFTSTRIHFHTSNSFSLTLSLSLSRARAPAEASINLETQVQVKLMISFRD